MLIVSAPARHLERPHDAVMCDAVMCVPAGAPRRMEELEALLRGLSGPENSRRRYRVRKAMEREALRLQGVQAINEKTDSRLAAMDSSAAAAARSPPAPAPAPPASPSPPLPATSRSRRRTRSRSGPQSGSAPNIDWCAVSMGELRAHPSFVALPSPHEVVAVRATDIRLFRQSSRQWWECHAGRITTSACAACLGMYEEKAARLLGVPVSLRAHRKALEAHARLLEPLLTDFSLLYDRALSLDVLEPLEAEASYGEWVAHPAGSPSASYALLAYQPPVQPRLQRRARQLQLHSIAEVRMAWGNSQEATSVLAALNYFGAQGAVVEEAGMQPLEALSAAERRRLRLPDGLPPIGASPDALVRWPDGSAEPLEVKNHSPFASRGGAAGFELRDPGPFDEVAVWHLPQLYLHMLCMGHDGERGATRSALFMSCSATRGANVFRVHRDETLMRHMLDFVARFSRGHGAGCPPPEPNFFWREPAYSPLLRRFKAAQKAVELVAHIPNCQIQRGGAAAGEPFFL